jgi:hypothetical protein
MISSESVDTTTSSIHRADNAALTAQKANGCPPINLMFFNGMDFDPPRSGINATFLGIFTT